MEVYEHYFNHVYSYDLVTLQECVKSLTAESTFFIHLPVGGRRHEGSRSDIVDPSTSESAFWPLLPHSTPNLRADRGGTAGIRRSISATSAGSRHRCNNRLGIRAVQRKSHLCRQQAKISELTRTKIIQRLRGHAEPKRFSLTSHISDRLRLLRDQQRMRADDAAILRDLNVTQLALDHFSQSEEDVDEWKRIYKQFDKLWEDTQEYDIRTQARGIIVPAATAMTMMLRVFRPQQLIVDEASQLTEWRLSLSFRGFLKISGRFSSLGIRAKKSLLCLTRIPS